MKSVINFEYLSFLFWGILFEWFKFNLNIYFYNTLLRFFKYLTESLNFNFRHMLIVHPALYGQQYLMQSPVVGMPTRDSDMIYNYLKIHGASFIIIQYISKNCFLTRFALEDMKIVALYPKNTMYCT